MDQTLPEVFLPKQRKITGETWSAVHDVLFENLKKTIVDCIAAGSSLVLCGPDKDPQLHSLPGKAMVGIPGDVRVVKLSKDVCGVLMNEEVVLSPSLSQVTDGLGVSEDQQEGVQFQKVIVNDPLVKTPPKEMKDNSYNCLCTHCSTTFSRLCPIFNRPQKKKLPARATIMRRKGRQFPCDLKRSQKVPCKYCGKLIGGRSLRYHLEHHEGKSYKCQHCDKSFETPFSRNRHERIHLRGESGDLKCSHCPKRFHTPEAYRVHLNTKHKRLRRFFCDVCGKGWYFANQLEMHRRIHTGEQPHVCSVCGRGFRVKHGLTLHMKQHDPSLSGRRKKAKNPKGAAGNM